MSIKDVIPQGRKATGVERRTEPFGVAPLQREINRLFDEFWAGWGVPDLMGEVGGNFPAPFEPRVNVVETDQEFKVTAELPGMDEKDVQVTVDEGLLTLQGEKQAEKEEKEGNFHRVERSYGSFQRIFRLPGNTQVNSAKARFQKGVLTVTLTKKPEDRKNRKAIKIEAA